jgi:hypothetical protein
MGGFACGGGSGGGPADAGRPDAGPPLCIDNPECEGEAVSPLAGSSPMVISFLEIGDSMDGFDLDHDGDPDNKMSAVGALAGPAIRDSFDAYDIIIPIEFFDFPEIAADTCVKFAIYIGDYKQDVDLDGETTADPGGDCNDHDLNVSPDLAEVPDNFKDDDCDGLADETEMTVDGQIVVVPSMNTDDVDGDLITIADGDCDDTNPDVLGPSVADVCGDGFDNDCSGAADHGSTPEGDPDCSPYDATPDQLTLDPLSFLPSGDPVIVFDDGILSSTGSLTAGPSIFSVTVPVSDDINLDLRITCAQIEAQATMTPNGIALSNGRLGGVLDAHTLDQVRGLDVSDIGLKPEDSLLDATFANILGTIIGLKKNDEGCLMPDIDVDRDGLEAFCDSDPLDDKNVVDTCIDGDGTRYTDQVNGTETIHCTEVTNDDGTYKFIDGVSVELNFETVPAILPALD